MDDWYAENNGIEGGWSDWKQTYVFIIMQTVFEDDERIFYR